MTTPTTLNILGGISPLLWLIFTWVIIKFQHRHNRRIWSERYWERQLENKQIQGKCALACTLFYLLILVLEHTLNAHEAIKLRDVSVRTLVMLYMISWGFLLNKIMHASNHLASVDRLSEWAKGAKAKKQRVWEMTLLNHRGWQIPEPIPGTPRKEPSKRGKKVILEGGNIKEVQARTAQAIRTIDCTWLVLFSIVIPTVEFCIRQKSIGLLFGPLRIL